MKTYGSISITKVEDGVPGVSVELVTPQYYFSDSNTDVPSQTAEWLETLNPEEWQPTQYVWYREKITYSNGSETYTEPRVDSALSVIGSWCANNDKTYIDGGKIYTGSVTADKIDVNNLAAINANLGTVTSGEIKSSDYEKHSIAVWDSADNSESDSESLAYTLNDDGTSYSVSGIGTCTDTDIVIPDYYNGLPVTSIGESAFSVCSNITVVTIGNNITSIGMGAFIGCGNLIDVTIPDSVTYIGDYAFSGCDNLANIIIPEGVTYVGEWAIPMDNNIIIIYCKAESQPESWNDYWNANGRPVYYYSETAPTTEGNYWHYKDTEGFKISCNDDYLIDTKSFKVTPNGHVDASSGKIANWDITENGIEKGSTKLLSDDNITYDSLVPMNATSPVRLSIGSYQSSSEVTFDVISTEGEVDYIYETSHEEILNAEIISMEDDVGFDQFDLSITISGNKLIIYGWNKYGPYDGLVTLVIRYVSVNARFQVLDDGSLYASAAKISGNITMNDGEIGGWIVNENGLYKNTTKLLASDNIVGDSLVSVGETSPIRFDVGLPSVTETFVFDVTSDGGDIHAIYETPYEPKDVRLISQVNDMGDEAQFDISFAIHNKSFTITGHDPTGPFDGNVTLTVECTYEPKFRVLDDGSLYASAASVGLFTFKSNNGKGALIYEEDADGTQDSVDGYISMRYNSYDANGNATGNWTTTTIKADGVQVGSGSGLTYSRYTKLDTTGLIFYNSNDVFKRSSSVSLDDGCNLRVTAANDLRLGTGGTGYLSGNWNFDNISSLTVGGTTAPTGWVRAGDYCYLYFVNGILVKWQSTQPSDYTNNAIQQSQ